MKRHLQRPLTSALALTGAFCATTGSAADAPGLEERLQALEKQVQTLAQENAVLKKELGWDGKKSLNLVEDKGKAATLGVGGYLQAQAGFGEDPDPRFLLLNEADGFSVRRARMAIYGSFLQHFDFKVEGDFAGLGSGLRAQLTDGYINWNRYEFLNIKAGQYKTHFGYEQLLADTGTPFVERSYVSDRLTVSRQIGASVTGSVLEKRLSYAAGLFNGNNVNNSVNDGDDFLGTLRIEGLPLKTKVGDQALTLGLGLNGLLSEDTATSIPGFGFRTNPTGAANNTFNGRRYGFGGDVQFTFGPVGIQEEVIWMNFQPSAGNLTATALDDDFNSWGYVTTITYDILPKKLQALARYEKLDTDDDLGGSSSQGFNFGLTYFIKGHDLKLMANYLYGKIESTDDWRGRFLARLQVAF